MPNPHRLALHMRDERYDLVLQVHAAVWKKIVERLDSPKGPTLLTPFMSLRTVDGRCVVINLEELQAASHDESAVEAPMSPWMDNEPTVIALRGQHTGRLVRHLPAEAVADLVMALEHGPDVVRTIKLVDNVGQELLIMAAEVVLVIAPAGLLDRGYAAFEVESNKN